MVVFCDVLWYKYSKCILQTSLNFNKETVKTHGGISFLDGLNIPIK